MKLVAMDVESWGDLPEYALQAYRLREGTAYLTSFAVADETSTKGTLRPTKEQLRKWLRAMAAANVRIVGWNVAFDMSWLIAMGLREEVFACKWLDAMLLWRQLEVRPEFAMPAGERQSFSLKNAVRKFFPEHADYEKDVSFDPSVDPEGLLKYNKLDSMLTFMLANLFWNKMTPEMQRVAKIEAATLPMLAEAIVEGLHIDTNAARELDKKLEDDANLAYVALRFTEPDRITPEVLASPKQLGDLLYKTWALPIPKMTDKGAASTDKEALWILAHRDDRAKLVRDYREATGNRKKFVTNTLTSVEYNGGVVTRPQPRISSTYTARMTFSSKQGKGKDQRPIGVPIHQFPRNPIYRRQVKSPPGYTLMEFDFSGQEYRWMAVMSEDPTMLKLCQPGEDAHTYMGARIVQMPYMTLMQDIKSGDPDAKPKRQLGKIGNLSCQYRVGANRLQTIAQTQYNTPMSASEARTVHSTYRKTYRYVPDYWSSQVRKASRLGYVENLIGRRVYLGERSTWRHEFKWSYESTAINFPIQSIGAEQKYAGLLMLHDLLPRFDGKFYLELHDGLFVIVPDAKAELAAATIKQVLSNIPYKKLWGIDLPIQFPVDAKLGKSWGDLKEFSE